MNLVRRNTWNVFDQMNREFDALLRNPLTPARSSNDSAATGRWIPAVDIQEDENQLGCPLQRGRYCPRKPLGLCREMQGAVLPFPA